MQVTIEIPDEKASFVLELLQNLSFVEVKKTALTDLNRPDPDQAQDSTSVKTASLLGVFPMLTNLDVDLAREKALINKHS